MSDAERLQVIAWFGMSIMAISLGGLIGLLVWYWKVGRK